jgi:NAD+ synthase (glutamine-hydrolysing)
MTVRSLYARGFARVAACTADVWIAAPSRNAAGIAAVARQCSEQGVAVALFPELSLTGYAIDDLLGQQALLDAVHAALGSWRRRRPTCCQ